MAIIDSLLVALGYEFDDEDAKKFEKANEVLTKSIVVLAAAAVTAATAITGWTVSSANATNETAKLARNARLAVDEFDALAFAAGQAEIEGAALANGLESLAIKASEAARGIGSGVEAFGLLNIQATDANGAIKTTDQLLLETADALNNLEDQGQRLELADKLGLKDLNLLLLEGSEGINKLTDEARSLGVITAKDAKVAEDFIDEWARFTRVISQVGRLITTKILPIITKLVEGVREFIKDNEELMSSGVVTWFLDFSNSLRLVAASMIVVMGTKFILWIIKLTKSMKLLGIAGLKANAKIAIIPILMAAAFAGLVIIIEDIIAFFQGKKSVTGIIIDEFTKMFDDLEKGFDSWLRSIGDAIQETIKDVQDLFKPVLEIFDKLFGKSSIHLTASGTTRSITEAEDGTTRGMTEAETKASEDIFTMIDNVSNDTTTTGNLAAQASGVAREQTANVSSSSSKSSKTEIGQVIIQVDGGDPAEVRRVVQETLSGEVQQATTSLGSAVAG